MCVSVHVSSIAWQQAYAVHCVTLFNLAEDMLLDYSRLLVVTTYAVGWAGRSEGH